MHCCSLVLSRAPHLHPALYFPVGLHLCAPLWSLESLQPHAAPPGIPPCAMAGWAIRPVVPIRQEALGCQQSEPTGPSPNREGPRTGLQHCGLSSPNTQQTMRLQPSALPLMPHLEDSSLGPPLGHFSTLTTARPQIQYRHLGLPCPSRAAADQQEYPRPLPTFILTLKGNKTQSRATTELYS